MTMTVFWVLEIKEMNDCCRIAVFLLKFLTAWIF